MLSKIAFHMKSSRKIFIPFKVSETLELSNDTTWKISFQGTMLPAKLTKLACRTFAKHADTSSSYIRITKLNLLRYWRRNQKEAYISATPIFCRSKHLLSICI